MSDIRVDTLATIFTALGEQLQARGSRAHLVVIGGAALLALELSSRATGDVDVVALVRDGSTETAEPLPQAVREAAAIVGRDLDLRPDWLNAGPTSLIERAGLPRGFQARLTTVEYGDALTVSFAGRVDQVHLKLYAAVDRGLARDFSDLRGLAPTTDELQQAAAWVREHVAPGPYDGRIADVLHQFGAEDAGRLD